MTETDLRPDGDTCNPFDATMANLFRSVAERFPQRPALVSGAVRLTFSELDSRTDDVAGALGRRGISHGDVIATLLVDGVAMVELLVASAKLGATLLAMNWRLAPSELAYILEDARPSLCFVSDCFEPLLGEASLAEPPLVIVDGLSSDIGSVLPAAEDSEQAESVSSVKGSDLWYMLYTSGTTGKPKGCQHSHRGCYTNALSHMGWAGFLETDRLLLSAPLFHVGGLSNFLAAHVAGACVVIAPRGVSNELMLQMVNEEQITIQFLPVLSAGQYLSLQREQQLPLQLRMVIGGGGLHDVELLEQVRDTLDVEMILGYGQSEAAGFASFIRLEEQLQRPKSCGRLLPHWRGMIVNEQGDSLPAGEAGELLLQGPSATLGYINRPEATAEVLADGWLHTGDVFVRDEEGFLFHVGRMKELIKTGGENVYPAEVESRLNAHPDIVESCVVGIPDRRWGEAVKAFVVAAEGVQVRPSEIADWCRQEIAGYKRPRFVEFIDKIPRDYNGKPQRQALSARPTDETQSSDR